ncbi:DUF5753 domain-containing protein [Kitasatospora viridis]|uniref:DUF5753 domain-containing protein n=1 Tax=Kitasatospora viridis TaxID=281105 RepID=A0A561SG80_9ACTN|nr:hypothetical protein FHX73_15507 [Kitasatospora viridis]
MVPSERFAAGCDVAFQTNGLFVRMRDRIFDPEDASWFQPYLWFERQALEILDFSPIGVMGMFQTAEYARAIFSAGHPRKTPEKIEVMVEERLKRHELLERKDPPAFWVVFHEGCLRTPVGGVGVMAAQLDHLLKSAESPNVDFQVLSFTAGAIAAHTTPFTLVRLPNAQTELYGDGLMAGKVFQSSGTVVEFSGHYERMRAHALPPDRSLEFIAELAEGYRKC